MSRSAAAQAKAIHDLGQLFEDEEARLKRDVRSGEAMFEAQMKMRMYLGRHRPTAVRQRLDDGSDPKKAEYSETLWLDGGLRGELVATGLGDEGGGTYELDVDKMHHQMNAVDYFNRVKAGIEAADQIAPTKGWTLEVPPSKILKRRYRDLLPRALWPFDPHGKAFANEKAPPLAEGYVLNLVRGPGNLAEFTDAAKNAFDEARTRRDLAGWVSWLGRKLNASGKSKPEDRQLAEQIMDEAVILDVFALGIYIAASRTVGRVPSIVRRRVQLAAV